MAVGTFTLPICDGCKLPWLPVGWSQESDPRVLPKGAKPLRCGKCKSSGWDREHNAEMRKVSFVPASEDVSAALEDMSAALDVAVNPFDPTKTIEMPRNVALNEAMEAAAVVFMPLDPEACADVEAAQEASRLASYVKLVPEPRRTRCKHHMTDCPICNPKEAA